MESKARECCPCGFALGELHNIALVRFILAILSQILTKPRWRLLSYGGVSLMEVNMSRIQDGENERARRRVSALRHGTPFVGIALFLLFW